MTDELSTPLGRKRRTRRSDGTKGRALKLPLARIFFGLIVLIALGVGARLLLVNDPEGGRPVADVDVARNTPKDAISGKSDGQIIVSEEMPIAGSVEAMGQNGLDTGAAPAANIDLGEENLPATLDALGVRPELVEESPNGPLPRIGPNGDTPFAAYARPSISAKGANGKPMVAIIITGMGLSEASTLEAAQKLPGGVTFAFAPYGRTLARTSAAAREGGHEIMLQVPLEPFDYPDNDPGPQTLLTGQPPRANLDRLLWLLARMGGYTAIINHMGARFTASAADFGPMMEEMATRGLGYVDDGSSNRSLAANLSRASHVPFAKASAIVDVNPSRDAILSALNALEETAREKGSALGVASALPVSIETIVEWARGLEDRNILLVPASAVMAKS